MDAELQSEAAADRRLEPETKQKHRAASALHAGHAGLLRLKRQWRPISRQLRLSDSDDDSDDSLSDFNSIADFHTIPESSPALQQQQLPPGLEAGSNVHELLSASDSGNSLAFRPVGTADSMQAAVLIQQPGSNKDGKVSNHRKSIGTGRSCSLLPAMTQQYSVSLMLSLRVLHV